MIARHWPQISSYLGPYASRLASGSSKFPLVRCSVWITSLLGRNDIMETFINVQLSDHLEVTNLMTMNMGVLNNDVARVPGNSYLVFQPSRKYKMSGTLHSLVEYRSVKMGQTLEIRNTTILS